MQIGGAYATSWQEEGIVLQKYHDGNARCIAILFRSTGIRGRFGSPDLPWEKTTLSAIPLAPVSWPDSTCNSKRGGGIVACYLALDKTEAWDTCTCLSTTCQA